MKVAIVHPQLRNYRLEIFEKLHQHHDVRFIFIRPPKDTSILPQWKYSILKKENDKIKHLWKIRLINELIRSRKEIDIIVSSVSSSTQSKICFWLAKITNKKFVCWGLDWYWGNSLLSKYRKFNAAFVLKNSDSCICYGTKAKNLWLKMAVAPEKIFLNNPCVVDYSKNTYFDLKVKLNLEDKKVILYLSRIIRWKGLNILIKAFKLIEQQLDNVVLLVVGDGDFRKECEQLVDELKIKNIIFLGKIPEDEVGSYYKACNLFVLPSIFLKNPTGTYSYEAWGLVINEAMSFGLPVVTTDAVGGGYDLVRDGYNGFVVKNKNIEQLYEALMKILTNPILAEQMGIRSREIFEDFNDYNKMFQQFDKALKYTVEE